MVLHRPVELAPFLRTYPVDEGGDAPQRYFSGGTWEVCVVDPAPNHLRPAMRLNYAQYSAILENDLAFHRTRRQEFDGLSRFKEREGAGDERVDLLLCKGCEDLRQILTEWLGILSVQHEERPFVTFNPPKRWQRRRAKEPRARRDR